MRCGEAWAPCNGRDWWFAVVAVCFACGLVVAEPQDANAFALFGPGVSYPADSIALFVATLDANGDGMRDAVVVNGAVNTVSLFLGAGDGTFGPKTDFATGPPVPWMVAVGDLNGDGREDLVIPSNLHRTVSVLLGNGDGTFQPHRDLTAGNMPVWAAIGDVNKDGRLDLAVANSDASSVSVMLGFGNGFFQTQVTYPTTGGPYAVALGDMNGDTYPDIVVTGAGGSAGSVLLNNGDGTFGAPLFYLASSSWGVVLRDFDGDGKLDLATASAAVDSVAVLPGRGDGTFGPRRTYLVGDNPRHLAAADVDLDGQLDLVVTNAGGASLSVLLGNGDGTFGGQTAVPTLPPAAVAVDDFNGDGFPDLAVAASADDSLVIHLNVLGPTPTLVSLAETEVEPAAARITWQLAPSLGHATVERRQENTPWEAVADVTPDAASRVRYEDRSITPGERYGYRLGLSVNGDELFLGEVWLEIPAGYQLAIRDFSRDQANAVTVNVEVPEGAPAMIELLDVQGRKLASERLTLAGAGIREITLRGTESLGPGVYFVRLRQAAASVGRRISLFR